MEETKQLKDAVRLRDAYILFLEKVREWEESEDWDDIEELDYWGDEESDDDWLFYKNVDFDIIDSYGDFAGNIWVCFSHHKPTGYITIDLSNCDKGDRLTAIKELLKDYKDLIE